MKILTINKASVLYEDEPFGTCVRELTEMEWKCYKMLKAIHGKEYADKGIIDRILSERYDALESEFSHNPYARSIYDTKE